MGKVIGTAFEVVSQPFKNAIAANRAHELNEERKDLIDVQNGKVHGTLYRAGDAIGDAVADTLNVATLGVSRKIGNIFDDKENKLTEPNDKVAKIISAYRKSMIY